MSEEAIYHLKTAELNGTFAPPRLSHTGWEGR